MLSKYLLPRYSFDIVSKNVVRWNQNHLTWKKISNGFQEISCIHRDSLIFEKESRMERCSREPPTLLYSTSPVLSQIWSRLSYQQKNAVLAFQAKFFRGSNSIDKIMQQVFEWLLNSEMKIIYNSNLKDLKLLSIWNAENFTSSLVAREHRLTLIRFGLDFNFKIFSLLEMNVIPFGFAKSQSNKGKLNHSLCKPAWNKKEENQWQVWTTSGTNQIPIILRASHVHSLIAI